MGSEMCIRDSVNAAGESYYSGPAVGWSEASGIPDHRLGSLCPLTRPIVAADSLYVTDLAAVAHHAVGLAAFGVFLLLEGQGQ